MRCLDNRSPSRLVDQDDGVEYSAVPTSTSSHRGPARALAYRQPSSLFHTRASMDHFPLHFAPSSCTTSIINQIAPAGLLPRLLPGNAHLKNNLITPRGGEALRFPQTSPAYPVSVLDHYLTALPFHTSCVVIGAKGLILPKPESSPKTW